MTTPPRHPREAYYAAARSWAEDRIEDLWRSRRTAWRVAAVAIGIAILEAIALAALAPLKSVEPYTILVDSHTGFATALAGGQTPAIDPQSSLAQSLIAQYVIARESADIATAREHYGKVAQWSAGEARKSYLARMAPGNPDNPFVRWGRAVLIEARVESVSPGGPGAMQVRFATDLTDHARGTTTRAFWVASLRYHFSGAPEAFAERLVNPLGLSVTEYRRDQEAPPQAPVTQP